MSRFLIHPIISVGTDHLDDKTSKRGDCCTNENCGGLEEKEGSRLARLCKHPLGLTKFYFMTSDVVKDAHLLDTYNL